MLLAWWTLFSAFWIFYAALCRYCPQLTGIEKACASVPAGIACMSWITLFTSHALGELSETSLLISNLIAMAIHQMLQRSSTASATASDAGMNKSGAYTNAAISPYMPSISDCLTLLTKPPLIFVSFISLVVTYIMSTHLLDLVDGEWWTSGNCYSDLPFHMSVMNSFLYGKNSRDFSLFKMSEVIYDGHRLIYPIIPDYFSAMLVRGGLSQRWGLVLPSWMHAWAFFFMLYASTKRFVAAIHPTTALKSSHATPLTRVSFIKRMVTFEPNQSVAGVIVVYLTIFCGGNYEFREPPFWLFFIKDIFLPQRSAMFAYTLSMASTVSLWIALDQPFVSHGTRLKYLQLSGFLCGLLPYLQGHAYICVMIIQPLTLILDFVLMRGLAPSLSFLISPFHPKGKLYDVASESLFTQTLRFFVEGITWALPAVFFGLPQMVSFMQGATRWGFAVYEPMWSHRSQGPIEWLWVCLGLFLYVAAAGSLLQSKKQWTRSMGFWVLFVITCYFKFQPWEVDNMKLFYVAYFMLAMLVAVFFEWLRSFGKISTVLAAILVTSFMIPGIYCVFKKEVGEQYALFSANDVVIGEWVRDHTGPDSVFLIGTRHNHPILCIGGKSVFYGYKGWLVSRGYEWGGREQVARQVYSGGDKALEVLRDNGIDYIALAHGLTHLEGVEINRPWFRENLNKVFSTDDLAIWEVREKGKPHKKQMFGPIYHNEEVKRQPDPNRH
eukprot:TRINITY_DN7790_c0_g3_i1.p1 TRINITY_DN7790_c0_g3~~TRINITY_DN7790_c0_g3_i1.p1  ORF type:complete len:722 (+),score=141.36 TRINITY_DN7790_c0_g3_i1:58-2223(+)